jgi:hypothetical protein
MINSPVALFTGCAHAVNTRLDPMDSAAVDRRERVVRTSTPYSHIDGGNGMRKLTIGGVVLLGSFAVACGSDDDAGGMAEGILLSAEGNRLRAYALDEPTRQQVVVPSAADAPGSGRDINGQICITADGQRFIAGEDTGQPAIRAGWGLFDLHGARVGELSATQVGKLTPTYQSAPGGDNDEPYGCGFLSDGRLITTDVGNQATGPPNGQVIIWFPPFDEADPTFCKLDVAFGTAGGVYVDGSDNVFVASARETSGVVRFQPPFPTSNSAAGGCGRTDDTGAPLATSVQREQFIAADANIPTPNGVVETPAGTYLVSSILNGVIAEYDAGGAFVRRILEPPAGESLGPEPYSTGSPLGLGVDASGTVYFADLGLVLSGTRIGPGDRTGSVRRIRFVGGQPETPETFLSGLSFPDGIGIWEP